MDKITKALNKFSLQEKKMLKTILNKIKHQEFNSFDLKKLKGHENIYRVRKGRLRIIFLRKENKISILAIERRSDNTYNI